MFRVPEHDVEHSSVKISEDPLSTIESKGDEFIFEDVQLTKASLNFSAEFTNWNRVILLLCRHEDFRPLARFETL